MTLFIGYGIYNGEFYDTGVAPLYFEHYLLGTYVGSFVTALFMVRTALPLMLDWVTKTEGSWAYVWRSSLVLVAMAVAAFVYALMSSLSTDPQTAAPTSASSALDWATFSSPITAFLNGFFDSLVATPSLLILASWILVVLPVIFVIVLTILFRVAQLVTVRVAENPKGPQYVLSVLLAAAGYAVRLMAA